MRRAPLIVAAIFALAFLAGWRGSAPQTIVIQPRART
jgi:hypothetical protein